jgi:hypothetical protein
MLTLIDYLDSLVEDINTSKGIIYHAELVKDLSMRRKRKISIIQG